VLKRPLAFVILAISPLLACSPDGGKESADTGEVLEVEEVSLPVDAALTTEADVKGPRVAQEVSGALPSDYPLGLPTPEASSVSGTGRSPDGRRFVEFESLAAASTVVAGLEARLRNFDWAVSTIGDGRLRASRKGLEASFEVSDFHQGSRIRVEYR
jgi:hypothetical protein